MCATVIVLGCLLVSAAAIPTDSKKLRNVIITSFGELPYEPMESAGFYSSDVIPVNLDDVVKDPTMDIALRTKILVADPDEKTISDVNSNSAEERTTSTNFKRQATSKDAKNVKEEDEFLAVRMKDRNKQRPEVLEENYPKFVQSPNLYSDYRQSRKSKVPYYYPYPPATDTNGYNINTEYYGDLGEGWNLQDAEEILRGRNYNILVKTPNRYPFSPYPPLRETPPPPFFASGARHPLFYSPPNFSYNPLPYAGFQLDTDATSYPSRIMNKDDSKKHVRERRQFTNIQQASSSSQHIRTPQYHSRGVVVPFAHRQYFSSDNLIGG